MVAARRVLVTGGTSSLGSAVVKRLAGKGDHVVFSGRALDRGAVLAEATGTLFIPSDVCEPGAADRIVERAKEALGSLDGLILGVGALHMARISETSDAAWDRILETNLVAPFLLARACMPLLSERGGAIVAIASGTAQWTEMELGAYSVSKRALLWMIQMLAVEGAAHGVTANVVCPGDTASGMTSLAVASQVRNLGPPITPPLGRLAAPTDIAAAVDFFLGTDATFCTGASLTVDGGMRAALRASKVRA